MARGKNNRFQTNRQAGIGLAKLTEVSQKDLYQQFLKANPGLKQLGQGFKTRQEAFEKSNDGDLLICLLNEAKPSWQKRTHDLHKLAWTAIERIDFFVPYPLGDDLFGLLHQAQKQSIGMTANFVNHSGPLVHEMLKRAMTSTEPDADVRSVVAQSIASLFEMTGGKYTPKDLLVTYCHLVVAFNRASTFEQQPDYLPNFQEYFSNSLRGLFEQPLEFRQ